MVTEWVHSFQCVLKFKLCIFFNLQNTDMSQRNLVSFLSPVPSTLDNDFIFIFGFSLQFAFLKINISKLVNIFIVLLLCKQLCLLLSLHV